MDSLAGEILKIGALGPVVAVLMWLLVRADKREEASNAREEVYKQQMFDMLKTSFQISATNSTAMDGVKSALEALKVAFLNSRST